MKPNDIRLEATLKADAVLEGLSRFGVASREVSTPQQILRSVLTLLNEGNISEAVRHFGDQFTYTDHAFDLEFVDKGRLTEFLRKARELFPDAAIEVEAAFEQGNHAAAEWKLTAREIPSIPPGQLRGPIFLRGTSVLQVQNGRIRQWSDYYDSGRSRRFGLAAFFTEWNEH
jgi:hypothetical protein